MILTWYFIGAWATAVISTWLVAVALADGDLKREHGTKSVTWMALSLVAVMALTWPISVLIFCGAMIRRAVIR